MDKMNEKFGKEYHREWEKKHRIERRLYKNTWDRNHREGKTYLKRLRRNKISNSNCVFCGQTKTDGHHPNYDKPYLIIFLCHSCHMKLHSIIRQTKNVRQNEQFGDSNINMDKQIDR
jgi:hypothetical protein